MSWMLQSRLWWPTLEGSKLRRECIQVTDIEVEFVYERLQQMDAVVDGCSARDRDDHDLRLR